MSIAGILIHAYPGETDTVRAALQPLQGVEVHHETDDGRFIITVEDSDDRLSGDAVLAIQQLQGVASATLAYHNFESENSDTDVELAASAASPTRGA